VPLTADQKATLQLLLERGQSYADLASMLGVSEDEVRSRARSALRELAGGDPDRNVGLTDYLLGQADPIGRADAVRHLRDDPADRQLADDLIVELRAVAPNADLPRLPGSPRPGRFSRRAPDAEPAAKRPSRLSSLTSGQSRLLIALGSGAVLLIAIVLAVTGAFGGDDGDDSSSAATTTTAANETTPSGEEISRVELTPTGGGNASGEAIFGLATNDQPYVDVSIQGLDPAPNGQTYVIWLLLGEDQGYPLAPIQVSQNGSFDDRFAIQSAVLSLVARVRTVDVSLAPNEDLARLISEAEQRVRRPNAQVADLILTKPGRTVLSGQIPTAAAGQGGAGQGGGS
jgi:Sigma-70, region 4